MIREIHDIKPAGRVGSLELGVKFRRDEYLYTKVDMTGNDTQRQINATIIGVPDGEEASLGLGVFVNEDLCVNRVRVVYTTTSFTVI